MLKLSHLKINKTSILQYALTNLGFDSCRISSPFVGDNLKKYRHHIENQDFGDMAYLEQHLILKEDPNFGLLHFKRQYSYAPNQTSQKGETRQVIYHQDWNDEIIVCPSQHSSAVAKSLLGTNIRVAGI